MSDMPAEKKHFPSSPGSSVEAEARALIQCCHLKLRLRPAQERLLNRWLWRLAGAYNWALLKFQADRVYGIRYSKFDVVQLVGGHGAKVGVSQDALAGTVTTALLACDRWWSGLARRPRMKSQRNRLNSIALPHGKDLRIKGDRVRIHRFGVVRFHRMEIPAGRVGAARIVKRSSGWYLCLFIRAEPREIPFVADGAVGIDPGFLRLLTLSSGEIVEHSQELRASEVRLAQAQRGQRRRLTARLNERIVNRRKDRNHKLSRRIVSENATVAWSKDRSVNLARLFGKSVHSAGHSQLRHMLAYKSRAGGRHFIEVSSRNSTRTCSACGALTGPTGFAGLKVRQWACVCGATHDRDVNAAVNTLLAGLGTSHESRREAASGVSI